jgi:hypothetical protein
MVMTLRDPATCHRAIATRDARFDGVFYLGVTSTKIYCRLICRARRPRPENGRFFLHAAAAGHAGFRPCRHYRPEQAPGYAPVDATGTLATLAVRAIEAGVLGGDPLLETCAKEAPGLRLQGTIGRLQEFPGMGPWTAHYFGMRIPGWPDDCIAGDLVVRKALAPLTPRQIEARSAARRPCRGDAEMHRWRSSSFFKFPDCPILP